MEKRHASIMNHHNLQGNFGLIPLVEFQPENPLGVVVVVHGYGGNKEEILGITARIASHGFVAVALDLPGHGESTREMDMSMLDDVQTVVDAFSGYGKVTALGHSLGGRLAFLAQADFRIGLAPALPSEYNLKLQISLLHSRNFRVREKNPDILFDSLEDFPLWKANPQGSAILYGSKDLREVIAYSQNLGKQGIETYEIPGATHGDIYCLETTMQRVLEILLRWYR